MAADRRAYLLLAQAATLVAEAFHVLAGADTPEAVHQAPPPFPSPRASTRDRLQAVKPTDIDRQAARQTMNSKGLLPTEDV